MPLYEYQCTKCAATLEAIQGFSAPPLEECPECGRSTLRKLLSAPAFQFKGSGWYVNDYARRGNGASGDADSNGAAPTGGNDADSQAKAPASESSADSGKKSENPSPSSSTKSKASGAAAS